MKDLSKLKEKLSEVLNKNDVIVDSVTLESEGKYTFLRVVLDKVGGIDLDGIVDATHIINPIIDEYDAIDDAYILDVISKERGGK